MGGSAWLGRGGLLAGFMVGFPRNIFVGNIIVAIGKVNVCGATDGWELGVIINQFIALLARLLFDVGICTYHILHVMCSSHYGYPDYERKGMLEGEN